MRNDDQSTLPSERIAPEYPMAESQSKFFRLVYKPPREEEPHDWSEWCDLVRKSIVPSTPPVRSAGIKTEDFYAMQAECLCILIASFIRFGHVWVESEDFQYPCQDGYGWNGEPLGPPDSRNFHESKACRTYAFNWLFRALSS